MKKVLFIAVIILGLSSCITDYKPIGEVKMDAMEYKFVEDTTSFDSYVKISDNTYYFYTLDNKELYAKVPIKQLMYDSAISSAMVGFVLGLLVAMVLIIISMIS